MRAPPLQMRLVLGVALVTTLVWALAGPPPVSWPIALLVAVVAGAIAFVALRRAGQLLAEEAAAEGEQAESRGRRVFAYEAVATVAAVVAIGFLWDSLRGQLRSVPIVQFAPTQFRITIQPPPRGEVVARRRELTLSLFFANGSAALRPDNRRYLGRIAGALRDCGSEFKIAVTGYASSRPFRTDNEARNLALANARAAAVSKALASSVRGSVAPVVWPSLLSMELENVINDRGAATGSILSSETLSRRADIAFELPSQCGRTPPEQAAAPGKQ